MYARDIMTREVLTVAPDTRIGEIARLLCERRVSGVPVIDADGTVVGIVSEGDLLHRGEIGTDRRNGSWWLRLFHSETPADFVKAHGVRARDVMTRKVLCVGEDTPASDIADLFESRHIKRVPVLRDGRLVGIVSRANLVRAIASAGAAAFPPVPPADREIRERLEKTLAERPWWRMHQSTVNVIDGVVHYWGVSGGEEDRHAARVAAEEIPGVRDVEDHRVESVNIYAE